MHTVAASDVHRCNWRQTMIRGTLWDIGDDASMRKIDRAVVELLTRGGARIEHEGLLDRLEAAGCRTDRAAQRCYLSERLIREATSQLGGKARDSVEIAAGWDPKWHMCHGGSHPHYLDWPGAERRLATRQDVVDMARMAHQLDEFTNVGKVLTCSEVDQRIEPLWTCLQLSRITDKPQGGGEVFFADYLDDLVAMGEVITGRSGDTSLMPACDFFVQPLILERNQAACFVKKRELGLPVHPGTMAVAGMSGPVTIAGVVALSAAELVAGWVLGYLINPDLPAGGVVATASLDMRTSQACFGSPEAIMQNIATANTVRRLYGIDVWPIVNYTDCKRPGLQAAFNKMFGLLCAPFGVGRWIGTDGLLSAGQDYCPVQHILDNEMNNAVERFWGHFEVNEDTLAVGLIEETMRKSNTNFLTTDHTLMHYQAEQWYPKWLDRSAWRGTEVELESEADMLQRINKYCKDAIAAYEPPEIDKAKVAELERIYLAAAKRITGANAAPL